MDDGIGLAEALLGLDGFVVLAVTEGAGERVVTVETKAGIARCGRCGTRAEAQDRMPIPLGDRVADIQASTKPSALKPSGEDRPPRRR